MSSPTSRLRSIAGHLDPEEQGSTASSSQFTTSTPPSVERGNYIPLSPTVFLPRAAEIEPDVVRRTYQETADRARGLAYYLKKHGHKRVGILCPNTPAFFEALYGISAAGAINCGNCYPAFPT
ncbi:hypothetical protein KEM54_006806 [Ascosphaera aggregata]|nr:hypothetical protein KEM54_006806 [Ascosphaera aggregata]